MVPRSIGREVTFFTHWRGGGQAFLHRGGRQTFYVGGDGGYDDVDVDEDMDVSKVNFLVSEGNVLHSI